MRDSGWYWVKGYRTAKYIPVYWCRDYRLWLLKLRSGANQEFGRVKTVGPRIEPEPPKD